MFNSIVSFELISHLLVFEPVNVSWVPFIDFVIMFAQVVQFFNHRNPSLTSIPAGIYLLKVKNRNSRTRCEIYLKLQRHQNDANDVVLLSLLLTLKMHLPAGILSLSYSRWAIPIHDSSLWSKHNTARIISKW